jgi:hypothetical protein
VLSLVVLPPLLTLVARWSARWRPTPATEDALERSRP